MKICIIGGGVSGWWCAAYMNKFLDAKITLIESNDIPILGVGESSLPQIKTCLLYTSPSPRDRTRSRMPSSA